MTKQTRTLRLAILQSLRWLVNGVGNGARAVDVYLSVKVALGDRYHPRPDDLFIVSYPKSGTTLMQMMLYQLTTDGEMDFPHIESVSPWLEAYLHSGQEKFVDDMPSPRIFKSHLPYSYMPRGVRSIYLARDLRDVIVSAYHHDCLVSGCDKDFESHVDRFIEGKS